MEERTGRQLVLSTSGLDRKDHRGQPLPSSECEVAVAGDQGVIVLRYSDGERWRVKVGYVGEDGIKPDAPYGLDNDGNFVEDK